MNISKENFADAAQTAGLDNEHAELLWQELQRRTSSLPAPAVGGSRFDFAHLAYYFGAMIVLGAMGWFMSNAWEAFGGQGIFFIATVYALVFAVAGWQLWKRPQPFLRTPGGLLVTLAVGMMPLMIYGLERWLDWWPQADPGSYEHFHPRINGSWIVMELGTILAGTVALRFVRFPFLTVPVTFALWFLSMDLTPVLFRRLHSTWEQQQWVSLWFGLAMLAVALVVDVVRRWRAPDYGFWLSLFGLLAFWGALTSMDSHGEGGKLLYGLLNVALMSIGVLVDRRACVLFGAIGSNLYLAHLAHELFKDSLLFPFALSLLGLLIIAAGVWFQRRGGVWRAAILARLPAGWREYLPAARAGSAS